MSSGSLTDKSNYLTASRQHRPVTTTLSNMSSSSLTAEPSEQPNVIGFYHVPDQIQRKVIRKGFDFTLLVAGESGLGKSTFINTLFIQDLYKDRSVPLATDLIKRTIQIEKRSVEIEEFGIKLRLTVIDTPGYGDLLNNTDSWKRVREYIEQQYESYFQAEISVNRRNIQDNRVHCCIYFIPPNGYGLHKIDIEFMKHLHDVVNIIPVIAKADTLTPSELQRLKEKVKFDIAENQIEIYDFSGHPLDPDETDDAAKRWNRELQDMVPFAVIGGNTVVEVTGRKMRARAYPWGIIEIDNTRHCDFAALRKMLVSTHLADLKEKTVDLHYENYRARRLLTPANRPGPNMTKTASDATASSATTSSSSTTNAYNNRDQTVVLRAPQLTTVQQQQQQQQRQMNVTRAEQLAQSQTEKGGQQSKSTIYKVP